MRRWLTVFDRFSFLPAEPLSEQPPIASKGSLKFAYYYDRKETPTVLHRRQALKSIFKGALAVGVVVTTALTPAPIAAWVRSGTAVAPAANFIGNKAVTVSNVAGSIVAQRTSGQTPCWIQVSGSGITASGTSAPYEDLEFNWNFGDASSTEIFSNPGVGLGTVNSNDGQRGCEAAHCYRSAGTYTITLTVKYWNGTSAVQTTFTQSVTVTAFAPTIGQEFWADSTAGGTNAGTLANPFNTIAAINTALSHNASNIQLHVKYGSYFAARMWPASAANQTGMRIDAYGTSSDGKPIFEITSGTNAAFYLLNDFNRSDIVITGMVFSRNGGTGLSVVLLNTFPGAAGLKTFRNIYFDNCIFQSLDVNGAHTIDMEDDRGLSPLGGLWEGGGMWGCTSTMPLTQPSGANIGEALGMFGGATHWNFDVGTAYSGSGVNQFAPSQQNHHAYTKIQQHALFQWIPFGSGPFRNYCIKVSQNENTAIDPYLSQWTCITSNGMTGVSRCHDLTNSNLTNKSKFINVVCQLNRIHDLPADDLFPWYNGYSYTHRYNQAWNVNIGGDYFRPAPDATLQATAVNRMYGNQIYATGTGKIFNFTQLAGVDFAQPQQITDNTVSAGPNTSVCFVRMNFANQTPSLIDRNDWYGPSATAAVLFQNTVGSSSVTFATWKNTFGFDVNGNINNPNWIDPANGIF